MRKFLSILIGLFLAVSFSMAQSNDETAEPIAYINYLEGEVFFRNFEKVELNMIIQEGDEINTTADGRVEILLKGEGVIRFDYNTIATFASLTKTSILLEVRSGNVYVEKDELGIGVTSVNRSLNLSSEEWYLTAEKSFKKWNNARNEELAPRNDEYLPEELGRYGGTLNHYGCWQHISSYGYVWTPYARHLRPGWRPYLHGRWDWYGSRRMWISYDPFGWPVHHYGRWHWGSGLGWYWIPMRTWGPAWVLWSILNDCIGWSPMYYGGYNSYYYRHHYNDYYGRSYGRAWTFVPRNRFRSRNVVKYVVHKDELKRRGPGNISSSQIRKSLSADATRSTNSSKSLQSQDRQTQSRQVRSKTTNTYPSRITSQRQKVSKSRVKTSSATSVKASSSSRISSSRSSSSRTKISNPSRTKISSSSRTKISSSSRTKISSSSRTKISNPSRTKISSSRRSSRSSVSRSSSSRGASISASKSSARRSSRSSVSRSSSSRGASRSRPSQSSRSAKRARRK